MTTLAWTQLEPALSALFARIAVAGGVAPSVVQASVIKGQKFPSPSKPTTLKWRVVKAKPVGRDELRETYDPDTMIDGDTFEPDPDDPDARLGAIIPSVHGQRDWTIEVRVESPNQSVPASEHFRALVDGMRRPSASEELQATGLAWRGWEELTDDEYDGEDGRAVSVYVGRLYFNGASYVADTPITTIERANITTNVLP